MVKARSPLEAGASTPAGLKRSSLIRIVFSVPFLGIGRIAHNGVELHPEVMGRSECVAQLDVELGVVYIVKKHITTAEVVSRRIQFLTVEVNTFHIIGYLRKLQ